MTLTLGTADDDLARLRNAAATHRVVNLVGPLGVGKTRLLARLDESVHVVDHVDDPAATPDPFDGPVVFASRRPLRTRPAWADLPMATVHVRPWTDREIHAYATSRGLDEDAARVVVRYAGGVPLIAELLSVAVLDGAPVARPGGAADLAADLAAEEVVRRLRSERPAPPWRRILRLLAGVGVGDEELLDVEPDEFTALAALSVVTRTELGLRVAEPYRTVLDMSYRWRRPIEHRAALTRAGQHVHRRLAIADRHELRKKLAFEGIFLADEPYVRAMLFPARSALPPVEIAGAADADAIGRLIREWALESEFDLRATDRLVDTWLADTTSRFHICRDDDGAPAALANLVPFAEAESGGVEPVTQQHTEELLESAGGDGMFVITGFWPDEATGAAMLQRILGASIDRGKAVICTPKPEYQRLALGLGFAHHGTTRHDTYGNGHSTHVFSQSTKPGDLVEWLARIAELTGRRPPPSYLGTQLTEALERIRTPSRLARSPLLAAPHTPTVPALRDWLTAAVESLCAGTVPVDAEAGRILRDYYLGGAGSHRKVASRLHLSRATYFRRLAHGLAVVTERFGEDASLRLS